ncbi:hypothetical protein [uncultured Desulfuromusa sp.]|uniref:hypothetical protein n=1 Tax=uncultured Desulfuromusa sp. TaxID=219183 RepID=UPI002AA94857|nr:hypothetical protein [uncultured Desulfuromusa sp.]
MRVPSKYSRIFACLMLVACLIPKFSGAADIRAIYGQVATELEESQKTKIATKAGIQLQRNKLKQQLREIKAAVAKQEKMLQQQNLKLKQRQQEYSKLSSEQADDAELMNNLAASVRVSAKQLQELLIRSSQTSLDRQRPESLDKVLNADYFPGLADMQQMAGLYLTEMKRVGRFLSRQCPSLVRREARRRLVSLWLDLLCPPIWNRGSRNCCATMAVCVVLSRLKLSSHGLSPAL